MEAASIAKLAVLQKLEAIDRAVQYNWRNYPQNIENRKRLALLIAEFDDSPALYGYHHLSRHCDILTSIETRISMLNMTYSKFIDSGYCCFIPGKVIDEIRRVLYIVETSATPPRAHEVLQELRDISSMAIEHFDDKISPAFRQKMNMMVIPQPSRAPTAGPPLAIRQDLLFLRKRCMLNTKISLCLANQYKKSYKQMLEYKKVTTCQQKTIRNLTKKQREQDAAIADLKKRIEECDIKYSELTHTNQAAGGKAKSATSAGEVVVASTAAQPLRHFSSQIQLDLSVMPIGTNQRNNKTKLPNMKPRKPVIKLPSLSEDSGPPAKVQKIDESPAPDTSIERQSPRTRSQCVLAKIRGITNELRQLSNISKAYDSKRKIGMIGFSLNAPDSKKKKFN